MFGDPTGHVADIVWDAISLFFSVVDVCVTPADPWAWAGLAGDVIDLIPFLTGVGEAVDVIRIAKTADNVLDAIDDIHDAGKTIEVTVDSIETARTFSRVVDKTSDIKRLNGTYEIIFKNG